MQQPKFIDYQKSDNKGMDYEFLRTEGIDLIQKLTGAFWTDYNEHDPGVTILEQLCYALTEISYRTQFDIKDILHSEKGKDQSFFRPDQILPCNALTINDYRKLLFDSVFEIKNVWLFPADRANSKFNGLYNILLDVDESVDTEAKKKRTLSTVLEVFNENRNLGEDVEEISVLNTLGIKLLAEIDLTGEVAAEQVMAKILFKVDEYLSPEIKFYSLEELLEEKYSLNDIFNGPLLKHGFIKTEELPPKIDKILISEVMKIIMQIEGISSVKNLKLVANETEYENQIDLEATELPKLVRLDDEGQEHHAIHFHKNGIPNQLLNLDEVKRSFNELKSANRRVYRLSEEIIEVPEGQKLPLKDYYSIQNQFPNVYGIGEDGIPNSPTEKRKAQAFQLKGYLMLFEQIIANAFAQLDSTKDLLSIGGSYHKSYYTQPLTSVPNAALLFKQSEDQVSDQSGTSEQEFPINYEEALPQIIEKDKELNDRTLRLLDYLLALHGEEFGKSLSQFNYYFGNTEFEQYLVKNKTYFLQFLPFINKNRTKGFNYKKEIKAAGNLSGIEAKISVLLGLSSFAVEEQSKEIIYQKKSFFEHFAAENLKLIEKAGGTDLYTRIDKEVIDERFEIVDEEEIDLSKISAARKEQLLSKSIFKSSGIVTIQNLKDGISIENYRVGTVSDKIKSISVAIYSTEHDGWLEVAKYRNADDAEQAVLLHSELFKVLNIKGEGVHLIEHIILRPEPEESKFGIYIKDERGRKILASNKTYTFEERLKVIDQLMEYLHNRENYSVEITKEKDFEIQLSIKELGLKFVSVHANESVEATHEQLDQLLDFINNKNIVVPFDKKVGVFVKYSKESPRLPEEFFSLRASVFFPDWTARFANPEFKSLAEEVVFKEQPASVALNTHWLNIEQVAKLEKHYFDWAALKAKDKLKKEEKTQFHATVDALTSYIFQFYAMEA